MFPHFSHGQTTTLYVFAVYNGQKHLKLVCVYIVDFREPDIQVMFDGLELCGTYLLSQFTTHWTILLQKMTCLMGG